ncbi:MAG: hypothetical protein WCF67_12540 [Chitinophagaceae bacterium]
MKQKYFLLLITLVMAIPAAAQRDNTTGQTTTAGSFDWNIYSFVVPEKWGNYKTKDYISLAQSQNPGQGCLITILTPQPSSGNLEADTRSVFAQMYPGWQYRFTGEKHHDLSKGYTLQGLEYCMMEAPMHKMRPDGFYYDYEDGAVWVIGFGKQVAIVAARHNRLLACVCNNQYEYWRRFFNSFTVKDQPAVKNEEDVSKRIVGSWMAMGSGALTEYTFGANGNYQFIGAYTSTSKTSREYYDLIELKTSSWKGDGSYSVKGNQLTFKKHGDRNAEQVPFRFDKVNHGDKGWKDRLYMLKVSAGDGKQYEVCYEKGNK